MKIFRKIYMGIVMLFLYAPLLVMVFFSFNKGKDTFVFKGFTLDNYIDLFTNGDIFIDPLLNTLLIAILSAVIATVLGTLAAYGIFKLRSKIAKSAIMTVTNIPMMNPDIVTGISLMLLFVFIGRILASSNQLGFVTILIAHITFNLPYVILSVLPKFNQMDKHLPEAALDLGCTPTKTFMKVILPNVSSGVLTGFIMAFTLSLDDFVISYFTSGHFQTLPVLIYTMVKKPLRPNVYALYTIILLVIFVMLIFYNISQSREVKVEKKGTKAVKTIAIILVFVLIFVGIFTLKSCSGKSKIDIESLRGTYTTDLAGTTLYVYNWGEYMSDGNDDTINVNREFQKLTGIKVEYTTFDSNEVMYSKVKSGTVPYDIIIPSDYMIQRMINDGLLQKFDTSKLNNYDLIADKYKNMYFDTNNEYSVPYNVGMIGLIYNQAMVGDDIDSWSVLFDEKYKNQILTFDNPRDAFGIAQIYLGLDLNTTSFADWDLAYNSLKLQKPFVKKYVMDKVFNMMEIGEAAIAPYYAGDFITMLEANNDLRFAYPKEGTNIFVDSICIPKNAQNVEAAMMYIDFLLEPQIALANAEYICYASPNLSVIENEEYLESLYVEFEDGTTFDYSHILYPTDEEMPEVQYYHDLDFNVRSYYEKLWNQLFS